MEAVLENMNHAMEYSVGSCAVSANKSAGIFWQRHHAVYRCRGQRTQGQGVCGLGRSDHHQYALIVFR
jgi:hypothetical protein